MRKLKLKKLILSFITISSLFVSNYSYAGSTYSYSSENERVWLTLGAGFAPPFHTAGHVSFNVPLCSCFVASLRSVGMCDHLLRAVTLIALVDGSEYASDAGILFGLLHNTDCVQLSASTGVAYVKGGKDSSFFNNAYQYSTIGIPFEVQAFWKPFDHIGIGIVGFANVNSKKSFAGATLSLRVSF